MSKLRYLAPILICTQLALAADNRNPFRYDVSQPLNLQEKSVENHGSVMVHDVSFNDVAGQNMTAYLVVPLGKGPFAAVLYVHWLGDPATSNRTEFLQEAEDIAQQEQSLY